MKYHYKLSFSFTILLLNSFFLTTLAQIKPTNAKERLSSLQKRKSEAKNSLLKNIAFRNIGPTQMNGRVVDIVLRLNPDKPRPTISLEDSFLWLLDRRYLGRWWVNCRDDLGLDDRAVYMPEGLDDKAVYMPEGDIKKKCGGGRGQSRGGYARRHGLSEDK